MYNDCLPVYWCLNSDKGGIEMMNTQQPEALLLADDLEHYHANQQICTEASAELRRQFDEIKRLHSVNAELLEILKSFVDFPEDTFDGNEDFAFTMTVRMKLMREARAAISKA